jgi:hypothetical protein
MKVSSATIFMESRSIEVDIILFVAGKNLAVSETWLTVFFENGKNVTRIIHINPRANGPFRT